MVAADHLARSSARSMDREAVCRYLSDTNLEHATLQFCERFDETSRTWNFSKHSHPFFELIFFLEGKANIEAGSESVDVLGFDVVIYPPGLEHAEHLDLRHRQEIICLWADTGPTPTFNHAITLLDERGTLRMLFEMVYAEFTAKRPRSAELIACYLQTIFLQVLQHFSQPPREVTSLVERCLGYIHEHYSRDFDIDELASQVAVSPSYLFRLFKKKMQVTPMHYRNMVRIDKAKLLLADQQLTVDDVAERVGFEDPKYFARVFRELTGLTPSGYRRARLPD
jgi:AraC-like DNA-binding protein/mannose-6-phosphate isomerase-like protein (cupin superfamily)